MYFYQPYSSNGREQKTFENGCTYKYHGSVLPSDKKMKIGIVCYPTYGGSGIVATELGKALADKGHEVHFISYSQPVRLDVFSENMFYHEVSVSDYPLFEYTLMSLL